MLAAFITPNPPARAECVNYAKHLHWLAGIPDPGGLMSVAADGNYVYAAASDSGLYVVDVSNPEHPVKVGRADTPGSASDVVVKSGYAYVADLFSGLQIIDVRDPVHPVRVGGHLTGMPAVSVAVVGKAVYVGEASLPVYAASRVEVYDASVPSAPELVTWITTPSWVWDIAISGSAAYLAIEERGLMRLDITDPFDPGADGVIGLPGNAQGVAVAGDLVYVGDGPAGLQVVRSLPGAPLQLVGSTPTPDLANGVAVYGSYVCVAASAHGLAIVDASDPAAPRVVAQHATPQVCWNVALNGSIAFVADQYSLECFDLGEDPTMPGVLASIEGVEAADVAVQDTIAYVACAGQGLRTFNVSDPLDPREMAIVHPPGTLLGVQARGAYVYTANWGGGISVTDVSDPLDPRILGTATIDGPAWDLDVEGSYAFVAAYDLFVVDVSDPFHPVAVGRVQTSPGMRARRVDVSGPYAYVTDETTGLAIVDVSVPTSPVLVHTVTIPGGAYAVKVRGSRAYVSGKNKGFFDIDVSEPAQAAITGSLPLRVYGMRFALDGPYLYVASNWAAELHILDVTEPTAPAIAGELLTSGGSFGITVSPDGYLYVADYPSFAVAALHCPFPPSEVAEPIADPQPGRVLLSAVPNPSHGIVRLSFAAPLGEAANVTIYDGSGRRVRRLAAGTSSTSIEWDGRDEIGRAVPNGFYLARLTTGRGAASSGVVLVR